MTLQFQRTVKQFVRGLLGRRKTKGQCFVVCAPLTAYLNVIGHEASLVEGTVSGNHHYWIELADGSIIDPTADQFVENKKKNFAENLFWQASVMV